MTPADPARPGRLSWGLAVVCGLLIVALWLRLRFSAWILTGCESAAPFHYLCADIGPWASFLEQTATGAIPYVDFSREYPTGAGTLFWLLGSLFGATGFSGALALQVGVSLVADLGCALLLFLATREHGLQRALIAALLWLALPTVMLISPLRYESVVALTLLGGYLLHVRGRPSWAVAVWSLGFTLKWYPAVAIAVTLLSLDREALLRRLPRVALVGGGVLLAVNGPYLIADLVAHGHVQHWWATYTFHAERRLAPDTVLGVVALWIGPLSFEDHVALLSVALATGLLLTRRRLPWAPKVAVVCMSLLLINRVYSPQFNLWFYPPLLILLAGVPAPRVLALGGLLVLLDLVNVAIFPFIYAGVVFELGGFAWGGGAAAGGGFTIAFTSAVVLRAFLLLALMALVYREGHAQLEASAAAAQAA